MAHDKIFGICESKCLVETLPKDKIVSKDEFNEIITKDWERGYYTLNSTHEDGSVFATSNFMYTIDKNRGYVNFTGECKYTTAQLADLTDSTMLAGFATGTTLEKHQWLFDLGDKNTDENKYVPAMIPIPIKLILTYNWEGQSIRFFDVNALFYFAHSETNKGLLVVDTFDMYQKLSQFANDKNIIGFATQFFPNNVYLRFSVDVPCKRVYSSF